MVRFWTNHKLLGIKRRFNGLDIQNNINSIKDKKVKITDHANEEAADVLSLEEIFFSVQ